LKELSYHRASRIKRAVKSRLERRRGEAAHLLRLPNIGSGGHLTSTTSIGRSKF
jgi:hypothetical protein